MDLRLAWVNVGSAGGVDWSGPLQARSKAPSGHVALSYVIKDTGAVISPACSSTNPQIQGNAPHPSTTICPGDTLIPCILYQHKCGIFYCCWNVKRRVLRLDRKYGLMREDKL